MIASTTKTITEGPGQTERLAARLAEELTAGDVVLIEGELGAGKTTFVRGAARALGVSAPVTSPTFTLGRLYEAPVPIGHLDLYRLGSLDEEEPGLLDDYLGSERISFVEWPEAAAAELGSVRARVRISHAGGDRRLIQVER